MTRDELFKRLIVIPAKPQLEKPDPRDPVRREFNKIDANQEHDLSEFESFFDFEKDISELESARTQLEKIQNNFLDPEAENEKKEAFLILDEDNSVKCGNENSFFIFEEEEENDKEIDKQRVDNTTNKYIEEEVPNITFKEVANKAEDLSEDSIKEINVSFKSCKYLKTDGEFCKRQAPKDYDYCKVHRKVLEKEVNT